jgi:NitT/TauT family transport system substrate-binding protein
LFPRRLFVPLLTAVSLLAAACSPAASPPGPSAPGAAPTGAANASGGAPTKLTVSFSNLIADNLAEWTAKEAGIFDKHGLDVDLENIASAQGVAAILSGQVQVGQFGGSETVSAAAGGADLVILGNLAPVYPFVFMSPADLTNVQDLRGKKIGVSAIGSSSDIATRVMLRNVGLDSEKDVTIVPVGSLENRIAALTNGAIQGGVAQPPDQLALEDKGFHVLYDLAQQKLPSANTAIVVQRAWLNANRDVAQRYVDSLVEAIARNRSDKAFATQVIKKYLKIEDDRAAATTYDFFVGQVTPQYPLSRPEQFEDAISQLSTSNEKVRGFDVTKIFDTSLVQSAMDRKVGG